MTVTSFHYVVAPSGVATITFSRPDTLNSLTFQVYRELTDLFAALQDDGAVKAVVLTGQGRAFCSGGDVNTIIGELLRYDAPQLLAFTRMTGELIANIRRLRKPVVAAVNGTAAGGGANLVLACDLVVMAENARLIEVFVRRGIIPDAGAAYLLPRIVGLQRAKEVLFLGDDLSAAECERWGIANRVVPAAELATTAGDLAGRLAAGPSKAIAMTKWLVNRSSESGRHTAFEEEGYAQDLVAATADMAEGMTAFAERRDPQFKGW